MATRTSQEANDLLIASLTQVIANLPAHEHEALVLTTIPPQLARIATALDRIADSMAQSRDGDTGGTEPVPETETKAEPAEP